MKVAIFGGTFNPIHCGHLHLCESVLSTLSLDRLVLMPTHKPPHKTDKALATDADRFAMCTLAVADKPTCSVSDMELCREGKSYTVDTLSLWKEKYPQDELYFLMGSDMLLTFDKWYRYEDILSMATIVAGARDEADVKRMTTYHETVFGKHPKIQIVPFPPYPVSSTALRNAIEQRDFALLRKHLPLGVFDYIFTHAIY